MTQQSTTTGEPPHRWKRRIWIALASLLSMAVAGEVVLRFLPSILPAQQRIKIQQGLGDRSYVTDAELGSRHTALRRETVRTQDFTYLVETDSFGFPNREPWPSKVDVIVLGNSLIIGPGVGIDGQFSNLLADKLEGRGVLNFGLSGGSPEHQYRIYRRYGESMRPRLVVACLWIASDIDNALHFQQWLSDGDGQDYTTYRMKYGTNHGRYTQIKRVRNVLSKSYLLSAVFYSFESWGRPAQLVERMDFSNGELNYLSVRQQRRLAEGFERTAAPTLRSDFLEPLRRLNELVTAAGSRFLVVLIPSKEELYGRETFPEVQRTINEVKESLESISLPALDLYGAMGQSDQAAFFATDIHLNEYGNLVVAEAIAEWVAAEKLLGTANGHVP